MLSSICSDVEIKGTIAFKGELKFDGTLIGGSISGETLVVGANAQVQGDITADFLTVQGRVTGNANVTEKTTLEPTACLTGDLATARLSMNEGASFFGASRIGPKQQEKAGQPPIHPTQKPPGA